jgi:ATPase subunit of ABC transporter with duplicated ATPase domains
LQLLPKLTASFAKQQGVIMHGITISGVTYAWSGEDPLLQNISFSLGRGIHALAGPNGAGKSTLLRLLAGELQPQSGSIQCAAGTQLVAVAEAGERQLSSGEQQMQKLEAALAQSSGILLFDEPERHLDTPNRRRFIRRLRHFGGTVLLATHDAELLDLAGSILHLEGKSLSLYRMHYAAYCSARDAEQAAAAYALDRAERNVQKELVDAQRNLERQLRRERIAAVRAPDAGIPKVALGLMKRNAEKTRGSIISRTKDRIAAGKEELSRLRGAQSPEAEFEFTSAKKRKYNPALEVFSLNILTARREDLWPKPLSLTARGGEKILISGRNGSGKSMLFHVLRGQCPLAVAGSVKIRCQRLSLFDQDQTTVASPTSILELARENFPARSEGEIRRMLGAYGYSGSAVFRDFRQLSTGQRVRLLVLLLSKADKAPDLLLADEAETGLDRKTRALFARFLKEYPGLLLFTTHSEEFAAAVQPTRSITLTRPKELSVRPAEADRAAQPLRG